jgi:urea transport system ATP-binding protein
MLAQTGEMAILLVEQYYDFAESLADQYLLMERGEFIMRGRERRCPRTACARRWRSE